MFKKKKKNKDVKRAIHIGLGLTAIALEKAESVARTYLKKENINKAKIKKIAKRAISELKKSEKIAKLLEGELKKNIDKYIPKEERKKIVKKAEKKGKKIAKKVIKSGVKKLRKFY